MTDRDHRGPETPLAAGFHARYRYAFTTFLSGIVELISPVVIDDESDMHYRALLRTKKEKKRNKPQ